MNTRSVRSIATAAVVAAVILVLAAPVVYLLQSRGDEEPAVDKELASRIRATGVTAYDVRLGDVEIDDVRVEVGSVLVDYDHVADDRYAYTLVLTRAPVGDLCGPRGSGDTADGATCTSDGDRMTTAFEEMGSFSVRRDDTLVTLDRLVTESDPGIGERAFAAIEATSPVSVDDLARP